MVVLTDSELQAVMIEATTLPVDKRTLFPDRIAAVLELRRCGAESTIAEAIAGLRHPVSQ